MSDPLEQQMQADLNGWIEEAMKKPPVRQYPIPTPPHADGFDSMGGFTGQVFITCQWAKGDERGARKAAAIITALTGV